MRRTMGVLAVLLVVPLVAAGVYLARSDQVVRSDWLPMFFEAPLGPQCYTYGKADRNCEDPPPIPQGCRIEWSAVTPSLRWGDVVCEEDLSSLQTEQMRSYQLMSPLEG